MSLKSQDGNKYPQLKLIDYILSPYKVPVNLSFNNFLPLEKSLFVKDFVFFITMVNNCRILYHLKLHYLHVYLIVPYMYAIR